MFEIKQEKMNLEMIKLTPFGNLSFYDHLGEILYFNTETKAVFKKVAYNDETNRLFVHYIWTLESKKGYEDKPLYRLVSQHKEYNVIRVGNGSKESYCSSKNWFLTDEDIELYNNAPKCPQCGSMDIEKIPQTFKRRIMQMKTKTKFEYKCSRCGREW